jgi:putative PIN family toxin of toxin-antitoxin system
LRAVVDTNVFLAGLLNADGGAAKITRAFRDGEFELVVTHDVFDEYVRVIHLFDNDVPAHKSEDLLELVFEKAVKVKPSAPRGLCADEDDEKFLSAALAGHADFILTKNRKHFPTTVSAVQVVNVREFLREIERRRAGRQGAKKAVR